MALPTAQASMRAPAERRSVLTATGLAKAFGGQQVLRDVSFELKSGEVILLRGENGSGKTTLLNIISGMLAPDAGTIDYGAQRLVFSRRGAPVPGFTPEKLANAPIARTWQDVRLFRTLSLADNIACAAPGNAGEHPLVALFNRRQMRASESRATSAAAAGLARFALSDRSSALPHEISLGQSKRVAIARAIAGGGRLLLLDEPLAGLDSAGVEATLSVLRALIAEDGLTLIIVEHALNQPLIHPLITDEWTLEAGKLIRSGPAARAPHAAAEASPGVPAWARAFAQASAAATTDAGRGGALVRIRRSATDSAPLLRLRAPEIRRGRRAIFGEARDAITLPELSLAAGDIVFLEAPNGWGKSTLLSACMGELALSGGVLELHGVNRTGQAPHLMRRGGVAFVASASNVHPDLTVSESIALAGAERTGPLIAGLRRGQRVSGLSGGEKQRLALWCALTASPRASIFLLDEPLAFLDAAGVAMLTAMIAERPDAAFLIAMPLSRTAEREISP